MPRVKHTEFTINERRAIETAANRPDLTGYEAISKAAGMSGAYVSLRCKRNPKFAEALNAALKRRTEKITDGAAKLVVDSGVSPADVINGLAQIARGGESESAQVSAWNSLADIFGMKIKQIRDVTDEFAGWTRDELQHFIRTQQRPARFTGVAGERNQPN